MLDETYWRTQMRSHTPIGLAVAFTLFLLLLSFTCCQALPSSPTNIVLSFLVEAQHTALA